MRSQVIRRLTATLALVLLAGVGLSLQPSAGADGPGRVCIGLTGMVYCVPPE